MMLRTFAAAVCVLPAFVSSVALAEWDSGGAVRSLLERRHQQVVVQQWDLSCGAAALATVLRYQYGERVTEREIALELIQRPEYLKNPMLVTARQGFSLLDLQRVAERREYTGQGLARLSVADLIERAPVIVPVNFKGYNHFVVFRGVYRGQVLLADPAWGNRSMPRGEFERAWIEYPKIGKIGFVVTPRGREAPANRLAPRPRDFLIGPQDEDEEELLAARDRRGPILLTNLALDISVGAHTPVQPRNPSERRQANRNPSAGTEVRRMPGVAVSPSGVKLSVSRAAGTPVGSGRTFLAVPVPKSAGDAGGVTNSTSKASASVSAGGTSARVASVVPSTSASRLTSSVDVATASQPVTARSSAGLDVSTSPSRVSTGANAAVSGTRTNVETSVRASTSTPTRTSASASASLATSASAGTSTTTSRSRVVPDAKATASSEARGTASISPSRTSTGVDATVETDTRASAGTSRAGSRSRTDVEASVSSNTSASAGAPRTASSRRPAADVEATVSANTRASAGASPETAPRAHTATDTGVTVSARAGANVATPPAPAPTRASLPSTAALPATRRARLPLP